VANVPDTQFNRIVGQDLVVRVDASGGEQLTFQWFFNGQSLTGATNATLVLPQLQASQAGLYYAVVSNTAGSVTTPPITVDVTPISTGPGSLDLTFDPTAGGTLVGFGGGAAELKKVLVQPDGRLLVAGRFIGVHGIPRNHLARLHPDGTLDMGFDPGTGPDAEVTALALQPDGKVVAAGHFAAVNGQPHIGIVRFHPDGRVDDTFQCNLQSASMFPRPTDVAVGTDGAIWVCGYFSGVNGTTSPNVARLHPNGSLDTSFLLENAVPGTNQWVDRLLVQPDGKVLLGGSWTAPTRSLVRLHGNGALDTGFHAPRVTEFGSSGHIFGLALGADGRIAIVGSFWEVDGVRLSRVALLQANGTVDPTFLPQYGAEDSTALTVLVQADHKVVIGGWFSRVSGQSRIGLARFNTDGTLDNTFDANNSIGQPGRPNINSLALLSSGSIVVAADSWGVDNESCIFQIYPDGYRNYDFRASFQAAATQPRAMIRQPDGRIVVAGNFTSINGLPRAGLARLHPTGLLDTSFDPGPDFHFDIYALALQADGKILVGGMDRQEPGEESEWASYAIARLLSNGARDEDFSRPHLEGYYPLIESLALQPDGKILIGGLFQQVEGSARKGVARLHADGSLDSTFQPVPIIPSDDPGTGVEQIHVLPDGRIVIAGGFGAENGAPQALARLNSDGTLDASFAPSLESYVVLASAVANDGSVLAAAGSWVGDCWGRLLRLKPDGSEDATFQPSICGEIRAIALQPDGKYLVATNDLSRGAIVRLESDGSLDTAWRTILSPLVWYPGIRSLMLQPDGRVLILGEFGSVNGIPVQGIARLNNDLPYASFVVRDITSPLYVPTGSTYANMLYAHPPAGTKTYAVEDQLPPGWGVTWVSDGGVFDTVTRKVKFGPFHDDSWRTLIYQLIPVSDATNAQCFAGFGSADGVTTPITGPSCMVPSLPHPADTATPGWTMTIGEVTGYGAAWRRGQPWSEPPAVIPIDYVTRAGALWRGGEAYHVDKDASHAPLWWVNDAAALARPAAAAAPVVVSRQLPSGFVPSHPVTVTIPVGFGAEIAAYAVEDTFPPGWTIHSISDGGELDFSSGKVKWGPYVDGQARVLAYQVTPPAQSVGVAQFSGVVSTDGASIMVSGASQIRESCRLNIACGGAPAPHTMTLNGPAGLRIQIEASQDLIHWDPVADVTLSTGSVTWSDPEAAKYQQRFYRTRIMEPR
jgi:uncharacterized delta-60 repeat protein